jgi:hypothetical protein
MQLTKHLSCFLAGLAVAFLLGVAGYDHDLNRLEPWRVGRFTSQAFPDQGLIYITDSVHGRVAVLKMVPGADGHIDSYKLQAATSEYPDYKFNHHVHILNPQ